MYIRRKRKRDDAWNWFDGNKEIAKIRHPSENNIGEGAERPTPCVESAFDAILTADITDRKYKLEISRLLSSRDVCLTRTRYQSPVQNGSPSSIITIKSSMSHSRYVHSLTMRLASIR